jgi:hypothetical protein
MPSLRETRILWNSSLLTQSKENIHHCKDLMKMIDELRHLDGVKGNFAVSETEYLHCLTKLRIVVTVIVHYVFSLGL